jgi:hypothetical protein
LSTKGFNLADNLLQSLGTSRHQPQSGATSSEFNRDPASDARRGAGYHHDLVLPVSHFGFVFVLSARASSSRRAEA